MKRNGISLIETMIAVSASSLLFLLSIGVLHQAMRLSSKAKSRTEFHQSNTRLAQCFRDDVHQAMSQEMTGDGTLKLTLKESDIITYRMASGDVMAVIREVKRSSGENVVEQDVFRMLDTAKCEFKILESPDRVLLQVDSEIPGEVGFKRVEMRVYATANRWARVTARLGATP
jgi:hypothetical protein